MQEIKNDYRKVFCVNGNEFYNTSKAADAIIVNCDEAYFGCKPKLIEEEYNPETDLLLEEDDERWDMVADIVAHGQRNG